MLWPVLVGHAFAQEIVPQEVVDLAWGEDSNRHMDSVAVDAAAGKVYWMHYSGSSRDRGHIQRANLDGTCLESVLKLRERDPQGLAVDVAGGMVYWSESSAYADEPGRIRRATLNGTVEDVVTGIGRPSDVALDVADGYVYWGNEESQVMRARLDGGGGVEEAGRAFRRLNNIAVAGGKVYYTSESEVERSDVDGYNPYTLFESATDAYYGIAVDADAGVLYFSDGPKIARAALDGSRLETLLSSDDWMFMPQHLAVADGVLYYTDRQKGVVARAKLDGSAFEAVGADPCQATPEPQESLSAWTSLLVGLLLAA